MKEYSCGFLVIHKSTGKLLACHPTGRKFTGGNYDIAKGHLESGETELETAIRELKEETGLTITKQDKIYDFGKFNYRPKKDLYVFAVELDFDLKDLKCSTFCTNYRGELIKEMDNYKLVTDVNMFYKSLQPIITEIINKLQGE